MRGQAFRRDHNTRGEIRALYDRFAPAPKREREREKRERERERERETDRQTDRQMHRPSGEA